MLHHCHVVETAIVGVAKEAVRNEAVRDEVVRDEAVGDEKVDNEVIGHKVVEKEATIIVLQHFLVSVWSELRVSDMHLLISEYIAMLEIAWQTHYVGI